MVAAKAKTLVDLGYLAGSQIKRYDGSGYSAFIDAEVPLRTAKQIVAKFGVTPETLQLRAITSFENKGVQESLYLVFAEAKPLNLIVRRTLTDAKIGYSAPQIPFQIQRQLHFLKKKMLAAARESFSAGSLHEITPDSVIAARAAAIESKKTKRRTDSFWCNYLSALFYNFPPVRSRVRASVLPFAQARSSVVRLPVPNRKLRTVVDFGQEFCLSQEFTSSTGCSCCLR